ncbi:MAG: hypothetical protein J4F31_08660 [Flavobacteriales bacterium]|nr:hypothetical protein [Flavobacteriales bacterium]
MKLIYPESCDNAPKHALIREIITAFCEFNWGYLENAITRTLKCTGPAISHSLAEINF